MGGLEQLEVPMWLLTNHFIDFPENATSLIASGDRQRAGRIRKTGRHVVHPTSFGLTNPTSLSWVSLTESQWMHCVSIDLTPFFMA